jgi:hypothetical protein
MTVVLAERDDDELAQSRPYTENGINVVALDRHGRRLHRARPERRVPTRSFPRSAPPATSLASRLFVAVLLLGALGLAIARFTG